MKNIKFWNFDSYHIKSRWHVITIFQVTLEALNIRGDLKRQSIMHRKSWTNNNNTVSKRSLEFKTIQMGKLDEVLFQSFWVLTEMEYY